MIELTKVKAENFMTWNNLDFEFEEGCTQIIGKNRSGKSGISEAVLWCMFGNTFRGTTKVLNYKHKICVVELVGYKDGECFIIKRTTGSTKSLRVFIKGNEKNFGTIPLNQNFINEYLGFTFDTFVMSTMFGVHSFKFTKSKDSERKKVIETLPVTDFEKYKKTRDLCFSNISELKTEIIKIETSIETIKSEDEKSRKEKIKMVEKELSDINIKLNKYGSVKSFFKEIKEKEEYINSLQVKISVNKEKLIENEKMIKEGKCYVCGNIVSLNDLNKTKRVLNSVINSTIKMLDKQEKLLGLLYKKQEDYNVSENLKQRKQGLLNCINELNKPVKNSKLKNLKNKLNKLIKFKEINEFWYKGFGNQGIISVLIEEFINSLNKILIEISNNMTEGNILVQFNNKTTSSNSINEKIEILCYTDDDVTLYENLCNSERQRIDMMVMFAFKKYFDVYCSINIVFFDEIFEGLDEDSNGVVLNFIKDNYSNYCSYIISHSKNIHFDTDKIIKIEKNLNGSFIV